MHLVGQLFSLEPVLTQSAWFRTHNRCAKVKVFIFVVRERILALESRCDWLGKGNR